MENKETYTELFKLVEKLKNAEDPKRKYEFILWLGKKLKVPNSSILIPENKVQGCVSEVFVKASFQEGKLYWEGYSDALITKGLLAFLINGMNELTPKQVVNLNNKFIEELSDINSKVVYEPMTKEERIKVLGTTSTSSQAVATHRSSLLTALSFDPAIRAKSTLTEYTFTLPADKDTRMFQTPVNIRQAYEMIQKGQGQKSATNFVSSILTYSKRAKEDFEKTNVGGDVQAAEYYLEIGIRKAIENNFKVNGETPEKEITYDPERKITVEFKDSNNNVIMTMSEIKLGALEKQFNSYKTKEEAKQLLDAIKNSNVQSLSPVFVDMLEDIYNQKFSQDN